MTGFLQKQNYQAYKKANKTAYILIHLPFYCLIQQVDSVVISGSLKQYKQDLRPIVYQIAVFFFRMSVLNRFGICFYRCAGTYEISVSVSAVNSAD